MLVYTVDCYNVFVLGDSQRRSTFIRTLCWAPMVLHGWFTSCATFQATCLQGHSGIPPVVANVVFVVGVLVILIPLLVRLFVRRAMLTCDRRSTSSRD